MRSANSWQENVLAVEASPPRPSVLPLVAACLVATLAFWAYTRTLLPGVDLGDTGGFQAGVLWNEPSARRAYPLYFALATPFTRALSASNPARGLNLYSAVWAAAAAGLLTFFVGRLTRFTLAGVVAGLLLAFSYTFWTQAVIAEVYSLHLTMVALCLLVLYSWSQRPTTARLAMFFAVYALAFGIAVLGAMQYAENFMFVWSSIERPAAWGDRVAAFWMDVTKSDWREEMVLGVHPSQIADRFAMVWWDAKQQFGIAGLALAAFGAVRAWTISRPWALFICLAYLISTGFALTYNVGDTHVFLLPSHFFTALAAGLAVAPRTRPSTVSTQSALVTLVALVAIAYAGWRAWDTWPAVDRHGDRRADAFLARLTDGIDERSGLLVTKLDWQLENILLYSGRYERPGVAWERLDDVLLHFPFLVRDNLAEDRDIVLTGEAANEVRSTYGGVFPLVQDQPPAPSIQELAERVPRGAPYVMTWLTPSPVAADMRDLDAAVAVLAKGSAPARSDSGYEVWAGVAGEKPLFH